MAGKVLDDRIFPAKNCAGPADPSGVVVGGVRDGEKHRYSFIRSCERVYDGGVFEQLSDQIDEIVGRLSVPRSFDAVVRVLGLAERLVALAHEAIGDLDAERAWQAEGATSMTALLKDRAR